MHPRLQIPEFPDEPFVDEPRGRVETHALPARRRIEWMAAILLVPFLGPIVYFAFGRSPIPRSLRVMLVAGGLGVYLIFAIIGALAAG